MDGARGQTAAAGERLVFTEELRFVPNEIYLIHSIM